MLNNLNSDEIIEKFYGGNPREMPLYSIPEAARYLKMPARTLRRWVCGENTENSKRRPSEPVIQLPNAERPMLSFMNLVEAYVLSSIRRVEKVEFDKVRATLRFFEKQSSSKHPFATNELWTDGFNLFIETSGDIICTSQHGQQVLKEVVSQYLRRIERDIDSLPLKIYPFSKSIKFDISDERVSASPKQVLEEIPKNISIDPLVSFGRPTLAGTGISTNVIAGRFNAGESAKELAKDYDITEAQIEEAISYEGITRKAA
jgi:uncharacterized protein (DUF433 family)